MRQGASVALAISGIWVLSGFVLTACEKDGDPSGDPTTYLASWVYDHDRTTSNCPASDVMTGNFVRGGVLAVSENSSGGLLATDRDGCTASFHIDGSTATAASGQSCTTQNGETVMIDSWTLFLYSANILWPERTVSRTGSDGASCNVTIAALAFH